MLNETEIDVLLIEDSPGDARFVRELLAAPGPVWFRVELAGRLAGAADRLAIGGVDVILLDLGLPDSQGLATLERVQSAAPATPVVVFSGISDTDLAVEAVQAGAQDYLVKGGITREVLTRSLRYAIERKRLQLQQQEVERRLRESEEQFRAVLESAPDAIVIVDGEGRITLINAQLERLFGYSREELVGQPVELLMPASSLRESARDWAAYFAAAKTRTSGGVELTGVRKDQSEFPIEVNLSSVETGNRTWVAADIRDITQRRLAERQLIEERRRAEVANSSKTAFLAAVSHEIRSPMNSIMGMSDLLWESQLTLEQRQYVEIFRRACSNLLTLIDDILDVSKIEAGRLELERVPFTLEDVLKQALELVAERARKKGLAVSSRIGPDVAAKLVGDPGRLRQILINLLGNAVKFTEQGSIGVAVECAGPYLSGELRFDVSDTGIGIPPGKLEMIFGDFNQADSSTTRKYGGTGLGLGISRRLARRMGGDLTVASAAGEGSTFTFTAKFEPGSPLGGGGRRVEDLCGACVLVIAENCADQLFLRKTLSSWGMQVRICETPAEALGELAVENAGRLPYSLAILDDSSLDSEAVAAAVREIKASGDIAVIGLTSASTANSSRTEIGLAAHAVKPLARSDFLRLICDALPDRRPAAEPGGAALTRDAAGEGEALDILLAEDSPDNRVLVQAYLNGTPHRLTFVEDGSSAVERFAAQRFDLVLMDIQMPVMDGLAATRAIRAAERQSGRPRTPVVALTANACEQDRILSGRAGCDAHLSKPISKQKLLMAIAEYGPSRCSGPAAGEIRISIPAGLEGLAPGYFASRKEEVAQMRALLEDANFDCLVRLGHNMKGTGERYGFAELTRFGAALEQAAKASNGPAAAEQVTKIDVYLGKVRLVG